MGHDLFYSNLKTLLGQLEVWKASINSDTVKYQNGNYSQKIITH